MSFEALANEILLDIFECIEAVTLYRAFYGLNNRFNTLLMTYTRNHRLNTQLALKYQLNSSFQQYFSKIIEQIISLDVLYDNKNPQQKDFFICFDIQLNQFIYLQSLSLCYINIEEIFRKIIDQCQSLPHLTYLKIIKCNEEYMSSIEFYNMIWSLPNLTDCRLVMEQEMPVPVLLSSPIKYLSISCTGVRIYALFELLKKATYLQRFHMSFDDSNNYYTGVLPSVQSITMFKLSNVQSFYMIQAILKALPNLTHLKVDTHNIDHDGYQWETLIDNHLSKLKIFHLRMHNELRGKKNNQEHVDELVASFHTRFWLEKHQWYIHCHYRLHDNCTHILLHTVSYTFKDTFKLKINTMPLQSNGTQDIEYCLYDSVSRFFYAKDWSFIECFNIRNLSVHFPVHKQFWENIPIFYRLNSLTVFMAEEEDASLRLQLLLDRAPNLSSLTIKSWPDSQVPLIENTHRSIHYLDLKACRRWPGRPFFSSAECKRFSHSSLARQCKKLLIQIQKLESIIDLINGMSNLEILYIESVFNAKSNGDYTEYQKESSKTIEWLQNQLPLTSSISNFKRIGDGITISISCN